MSMVMTLLRVTPEQIAAIKADGNLVPGLCYIGAGLERGNRTQTQILAEIAEYAHPPAGDIPGGFPEEYRELEASAKPASELNVSPAFCLQKEWHMLHYFLTKLNPAYDVANSLFDGEPIGEDMGYGPARLLTPTQTSIFAKIVAPLTVSDIQAQVDIDDMGREQIYAAPFADDDRASETAELNEAIAHYFPRFQNYLLSSESRGDGLLIWVA